MIGLTAFGESFVFLSLLFPGTAILIAAGALVATGTLDPVSIIIAGIIGAVLGDSISFWIGQRFGPAIATTWPFHKHPELLERSSDFFRRYGGASVFIGRFFGPLRAVIPLTAGIMGMPTTRFYVANISSAVVWAPALVLSGALLGHAFSGTEDLESKIFIVSLIVGIIAVVVYWVRRRFRVS